MKKFILSTFTFFLFTFAFAQQYGWKDISGNLPEYANYNDVHFIGEGGWITGWNDGLLYTPDGGETFQIQTLPANSGISSSVFMKSNQVGYVVTYSGKILKTENGGTNWTMLYELGGGLNSVHFPPTLDIGYTCGSNGKIYAFTDSSIVDITVEGLTATLESIFFPVNSSEGKLCGNSTIRRWLNSTWNNMQILDNTYFYNSIFFTDNNTGWVVGSLGKIFKTVDATTWNGQASPTTKSLNDIFFIDSIEGWAAGSEVLLHTVNGGENWTREIESLTAGKELRAIYFTSPTNGYVVGNGVVLKYGKISGIGDGVETMPFDIFPNPATSVVSLQSSVNSLQSAVIEIYDLNGRKLIEKQIPAGTETVEIDVSKLASGVYFCKISTDKKSSTKKLIVE